VFRLSGAGGAQRRRRERRLTTQQPARTLPERPRRSITETVSETEEEAELRVREATALVPEAVSQ
jgi:hypothetical protein